MMSARLPLRSALTNSNPSRVPSMVMNEMVPSSFLREATLLFHPVEHKSVLAPLVLESDVPQHTAGVVIGEL